MKAFEPGPGRRLWPAAALFAALAFAPAAPAQEQRFGRLTRADGLINSNVSSIVQDSRGFLWFGTKGGLTRYDGYSFVDYQNDPFSADSLSHNLVQTLYLDVDDVLWVGTYGGLNRFDTRTRRFVRYVHDDQDPGSLSNNVVTAIQRTRDGRLWVGTLDGLNVLDEATGAFRRYRDEDAPVGGLRNDTVRALLETKDGTLWLGTYGGLARYDAEGDAFTFFRHDPENPRSIPSDFILDLAEDAYGYLWLACWNGGLTRFNRVDQSARTWSFPDNRLYALETGVPGVVYAGSWGSGLYELDSYLDRTTIHRTAADAPFALTHDLIYSLFRDRSGLLWVGTQGGGLNKLDRSRDSLALYRHKPPDPASLAPGTVSAVLEDRRGRLWVGSSSGGLSRLDPGASGFIRYAHDRTDPGSLSNNTVNAIAEDPAGLIWVATNEGLNRLDPRQGRFTRFTGGEGQQGPLADLTVYALTIDRQGRHWYGYFRKGLERYDPATGERKRYQYDPGDPGSLSDNLVNFVNIDAQDRVWVGTNGGLNLLVPETDSFVRYRHQVGNPASLPSDGLRCMLQDSRGRLWFGTASGGLSRLDLAAGTFVNLFKRDGLSDNTVTGLQEDDRGRLWIGTNYGLNCYDPETGVFRQLELMDGLQGHEFSGAGFKNSRGELYFGGTDGLNKVVDVDLRVNSHIPPVRITSLKVFDRELELGIDAADVEELRLSHEENFISIEYAALDFVNPGANRYRYMLEGFDKDWIEAGGRRYASYTNLPGGRYEFRVTASNNNDVWNEEGVRLSLLISPSFWVTPAALILYGVLTIALMALVARWGANKQQLKLSRAELAERVRMEQETRLAKEGAERANRAKSDFLANLSHEIRTPMNAVLGYADMLAESLQDDARLNQVEIIKRSGRSLLTLLNDVLDLSRIEAGKETVQHRDFDLRSMCADLQELFILRAREKGIGLVLSVDDSVPVRLKGDETKIRQILVNLIGNAVKFTASGGVRGRVDLLDADGSPMLVLKVTDTGPGIAGEHRERIFDAFYQEPGTSASFGGTGLGLAIVKRLAESLGGQVQVESRRKHGSTFTVTLAVEVAAASAAKASAAPPRSNVAEPLPTETPAELTKAALVEELGTDGGEFLVGELRRELAPLAVALSPVLILKEWEGLIEGADRLRTRSPSKEYAAWFGRLRSAYEDLDGDALRRLAAELTVLLKEG